MTTPPGVEGEGLGSLWPVFTAAAVLTLGEGTFAFLISPYLESRSIDEGLIGGLVAVYGAASLVTRLWAGAAYASQRGPVLVSGAALASATAFLLIPTTGAPLVIALLVGVNGAAFAFGTTALMAAVMERQPAGVAAGTLMGLYTGSLGLGYASAGFVGGPVADVLGVGEAFVVVAGVAAVAAGVLFAALRRTAVVGAAAPNHRATTGRLASFRRVPRWVWLGFVVTLYINLVSGVVLTFFPLHGLDVGLTLSQIGIAFGIHGLVAALVRFVSAPVFSRLSYRRVLTPAVVVSGVAIALLGSTSTFVLVALAWGGIGLARGVLRVATAALVLDESTASDAGRGAASSVYLSGLDVGKVVGPAVGGIGAELVGIPATFVIAAVAFPALYVLASAMLRRPAPEVRAPGVS